jgi:hypothetical protein
MRSTDRPVLITNAAPSEEDQLSARKRRYALLMGGRLALFLLAAMTYPVSAWLAVGLLALSLPLPWMAVLIANDAPPRRTEDAHRLTGAAPVRQLESRSHVVIDMPENHDGPTPARPHRVRSNPRR